MSFERINDAADLTVYDAANPAAPLRARLAELIRGAEGWLGVLAIRERTKADDAQLVAELESMVFEGLLVQQGHLFKWAQSSTPAPQDPRPPAYAGNPGQRSRKSQLPTVPGEPAMPKIKDTVPLERVRDALPDATSPISSAALAEQLDVDRDVLCDLLRKLLAAGAAQRHGAGRGTTWSKPGPAAAAVRKDAEPASGGTANGLKLAFSELASKLNGRHFKVDDLKLKLRTIEQLQGLVPAAIARILAAISKDLARAGGAGA